MKKSKKLQVKIETRAKYAIEVISLLILCAIITIFGVALATEMQNRNIEPGEERIENTETEIYIYDAYDMELLRDSVNAGNNYAGKTVNIMKDIDLSTICSEEIGTWEPIGTSETNFAGTFDGKYHKIKNLYINTNKDQTVGFFKQTEETAIIKNVILENVSITNNYEIAANNTYIGGLVGWNSEGAEIINCGIKGGKIEGRITVADGNSSWYGPVIGGIAGRSNGIIEGCYNKAEIIGEGITNQNYTEVMTGGIVGALRGELTNSYNTGKITGRSYTSYVGGITGNTDNTYKGKIENTYNKGEINIAGTSKYIGGLVGRNGWRESYEAMEIINSYAINSNINTTNKFNGTTVTGTTEGKITADELKTYAITLGEKYVNDLNNINDKDPILYWEAEYRDTAKLNINQTYIKVGQEIQLTVQPGTDENNNPDNIEENSNRPLIENLNNSDFIWTSTNEDIAKVDRNGTVTGLKDGYTTIYATYKYEDEEGNEKTILAESIINVSNEIAVPQTETGNCFTAVLKANGSVWIVGKNSIDENTEDTKNNNPDNVGEISIRRTYPNKNIRNRKFNKRSKNLSRHKRNIGINQIRRNIYIQYKR